MPSNFDPSFGFIAPKNPSKTFKRLSQYSVEPFEFVSVAHMLEAFIPGKVHLDWKGTRLNERAQRYQINTWLLLSPILSAAADDCADLSTDDAHRFVARWIADWAEQHPYDATDPTGSQLSNDFAWYDMAAGIRMGALGQILAEIASLALPDETLALLVRAGQDHLQYIRDPAQWASHSNHGLYQSMGFLAFIALAPEQSDRANEDRQLAVQRINNYLSEAISSDGVHLEHSPIYHSFVLRALRSIAPFLRPDVDEEQEVLEVLKNIQVAQAAMFMPNGLLTPFGDGRHIDAQDLRPTDGYLYDTMAPELKFTVTNGQDGEKPESNLFSSKQSGFFAYKNFGSGAQNSYFAVAAWHHSSVHKQSDDLAPVWAEDSVPILTDPGRYGYEGKTPAESDLRARGFFYSDPKRIFVESSHAHSTIEIDGKTDNRREAPAYQSGLVTAGQVGLSDHVVVDTDITREPLVHHQRLFIYAPGDRLVVIDHLENLISSSRSYRQWWQFFPAWRAAPGTESGAFTLSFNGDWLANIDDSKFETSSYESNVPMRQIYEDAIAEPGFDIAVQQAAWASDGAPITSSLQLRRGEDVDGRLAGWVSLTPLHLVPSAASCLEVETTERSVTMATVLHLRKTGAQQAETIGGLMFRPRRRGFSEISWTLGAKEHSVRFRRDQASIEIYVDGEPKIEIEREFASRNREAQALLHARARIAMDAPSEEVLGWFDKATRNSWYTAIAEMARYVDQIGDDDLKLRLQERAYEAVGNGEAALDLAIVLMAQDDASSMVERIKMLLLEAGDKNVRAAYFHLGQLFASPEYDAEDKDQAREYFKAGAQMGHTGAIVKLAGLLAETPETVVDALYWYEAAIENGHVQSGFHLGKLLSDKEAYPEWFDPQRALSLFLVAADAGSVVAAYKGGCLARDASLQTYDLAIAKTLFKKAADAGSVPASYEFARLLMDEEPHDLLQIKNLLTLSKQGGNKRAAALLDTIMSS